VEYYNKSIVNNSQVEFIHVSQNIKLADALEWASSARLPWLTVVNSQSRAAGLARYAHGTPSYALIDASGKVLAVSEKNCIKKIKELTGK